MEYPNFYENIPEAVKRLHNTIVLYDGEPHYVQAISGHRDDGIFRIYMNPLGSDGYCRVLDHFHREDPTLGRELDKWLESDEGKSSPIIQKQLNSPKFNKFRPYPLGMCNFDNKVYYLERVPNRKTEQGLISSMVVETPVSAAPNSKPTFGLSGPRNVDLWSNWFRMCIKGEYPDPDMCLQSLRDPEVTNDAAAFHREFALVRGPLDMMFLAYQQDIVGVMPLNDFSKVVIGKDRAYAKEVVQELGLFQNVNIVK